MRPSLNATAPLVVHMLSPHPPPPPPPPQTPSHVGTLFFPPTAGYPVWSSDSTMSLLNKLTLQQHAEIACSHAPPPPPSFWAGKAFT